MRPRSPIEMMVDKACGFDASNPPPSEPEILLTCPKCGKEKMTPKLKTDPVWAVRCTLLCRSCWGDAKGGGQSSISLKYLPRKRDFSQVLHQNQSAMRNARLRVDINRPDALRRFKATRLQGVARYGDRPCPNILRSLTVGIILVAALLATEVQTFPVGCRDISAGAAPTTCVTGADLFQSNSYSSSFVCDFVSHVSIRPSVNLRTKVLPLTQRTVSNILQVFYHDSPSSNFNRVSDQILTCHMKQVIRYGSLAPGHPFQESSGTSGSNRLDSGTGAPDTRATVIQCATVEEKRFSVSRVGGDKHPLNSHVNTNNAPNRFRLLNLNLVSQVQIPIISDALNLGVFPRTLWERARIIDCQNIPPKRNSLPCAIKVSAPHHGNCLAREFSQPPSLICLRRFVCCADIFTDRARQLRG